MVVGHCGWLKQIGKKTKQGLLKTKTGATSALSHPTPLPDLDRCGPRLPLPARPGAQHARAPCVGRSGKKMLHEYAFLP